MTPCPPACAVCRDCPVERPHYCDATRRALDAAHARWVAWNEEYRDALGLARALEEPPYDPPAGGIRALYAWGEQTHRELHGLSVHAVDLAAAAEAGRVIANMSRPLVEALWIAYVERGDRDDLRRDGMPGVSARSTRPLPILISVAERTFMERMKQAESEEQEAESEVCSVA